MRITFKNVALSIAAIATLSSCSKEYGCTDPTADNYDESADEDCCCYYAPPVTSNTVVTSDITEDTQWTNNNIYELSGRIAVEAGATLTIQEGTIIKGQAGSGPNASALLVARNAKLIAEGTPDQPIIFTSIADQITQTDIASGNFASPNLDPSLNGFWGGLIILGNAPISASADEVAIEGIPTTDPNGLYGGSDPIDMAGESVVRYVSIRHGGSNIGNGNEINGLSLGGVGTATTIDHVEIVANQDDGVEFFGGTVDATNIVVWNNGDDAIDTDQSWNGTLDNFVIVTPKGHCFELDGPEGASALGHTIRNGNVYASVDEDDTSEDLINTDDNSIVDFENILITDIIAGQIINRVTHGVGVVNFSNVLLDIPSGVITDYIPDGETLPAGISEGNTGQADESVFGWTWASQAGAF